MQARKLRFEYALGAGCALLWAFALALQTPFLDASGAFDLNLYGLFSTGAALGWLTGNIYVARRRHFAGGSKRRLALYAMGPLSVVLLLRSFAPIEQQQAAPLVPVFGVIVYWIFFLVPVSFRRGR